jgi:hypothetical protein
MTIDFVQGQEVVNPRVTPSIKFDDGCDGYHDACIYIYIDDIVVAYFDSTTGGIISLPLATGPYTGGGDIEDVKYLQGRGFKLLEKENERGFPFVDYYIQLEGPR